MEYPQIYGHDLANFAVVDQTYLLQWLRLSLLLKKKVMV